MDQLREPPPGASQEEVKQYASALRIQAQQLAVSLESTTRLLDTTLSNNSGTSNNRRRPELPIWDEKNLESWIRRTNNAFTRAGINTAKDKFAYLESIITVEQHPTINNYFSGDPSETKYDEFITFLRERYGRSREEQTQTALDGIKRQGRLPSDMAAILDDQIGSTTIEDLKKAHFMKELPEVVHQSLTERIHNMSLKEAAKVADQYFHRDGTLRGATPTTVNEVGPEDYPGPENAPTMPTTEEEGQTKEPPENPVASVNPKGGGSRHGFTPAFRDANSNWRQPDARKPTPKPTDTRDSGLCWYHGKFGSLAKTCQKPCTFRKTTSHTASGNERGGRRQ